MQPHIRAAIEALLKIDSTVTVEEWKKISAPLDGSCAAFAPRAAVPAQ